MRWTTDGAQAVLELQAVRLNEHWETCELELGMVSEFVGWFGVDGGPLLRMRVEEVGESLCN